MGEQLELAFDSNAGPGLPRRLDPLQAAAGTEPFDDPGYFFEPWWPGARVIAFVEESGTRLQVDHLADPVTSFPELADLADAVMTPPVVLDGMLLVLDDHGRPDAELLRSRLRDPYLRTGTGAVVASDLLFAGTSSLAAHPFSDRRKRLAAVVRDGERCVRSRGLVRDGRTMALALESLGIDALSARRLDARYRRGPAADAWLRIPLVPAPAVERRPLLALIRRLPLDD